MPALWGGHRIMKKRVITFNAVEGYHYYPNAPKFCEYLKNIHRHIFEIRCEFEVQNNNREIEINEMQKKIKKKLKGLFGEPCNFGRRSCEDIAEILCSSYENIVSVEVLEDGYGGAKITK